MEKKSKFLIYSLMVAAILFGVVIIIMLLGGYIKDATTKRITNFLKNNKKILKFLILTKSNLYN